MITKAIIEEILDDGYHARVRIPVYNKDKNAPAATPFEELYIASINCEPGSSPALKVGDVVFVGFENNLVKNPIILGLLFRRDIDTVSDLHVSSLIADINVNLPKDTTIGEVQPKDLANLASTRGNLQRQIDLLGEKISSINTYIGGYILPIGGKIFYIDTSASGATYKFYDSNYSELTSQTVDGLANAVYYEKSGTSTKDKFYVVGTDSSDTTYGGLKYTTKYWGYYGQTTGATTDSIGSGKSNTDTILAITDTSSYSDSVFKWIKELRSSKFNGYDDWFIGSKAEQDQLRTSGLTSIYSAKYVWSSVELNSDSAYFWYYRDGRWTNNYKDFSTVGLALRAF